MLTIFVARRLRNTLNSLTVIIVLILSQTVALAQANKQPVAQNITSPEVPNNTSLAKVITPLSATDADGTISYFTIASLPQSWLGVLYVNNVPAKAGQIVTLDQAAQLSYRASITYEATATFTYTATDNKKAVSSAATYNIPIVYDIDLTLNHGMQASLPLKVGQEVTVTYKVNNIGTYPAWDGVFIQNFIPAELTYVRSTAGDNWRYDAKKNTWNVQAMEGNATKTVTIIAKLNTTNSFSHTAIVALISTQKDINLTNNSSNYNPTQKINAPSVENVAVIMPVATTEGSITKINPLKANVGEGRTIKNFTLTSVPNTSNGKLYVNNKMAKQGQEITPEEASALSFEPTPSYEGECMFKYTATDNFGATSMAPATYNITMMGFSTPVSLTAFSAQAQNNGIALVWSTASEQDNDYFNVERSQDGITYKTVGKVKGAGNSSLKLNYTFLDSQAPAGLVYYRLKQVDTDGIFEFSKVITVAARGKAASVQIQTYPNPFSQQLTLSVPSATMGQAQLQLLDLQGRVVMAQTLNIEQGQSNIEIPTDTLPAGAYIMVIKGNGIDSKTRVIKS
ncbi:T9SS type A sorting domain-containing protein [Pontibacter sp. 13R65]|uniref:T9SS type A sorting domain-containing protein n=1 Tax=Pontibacter sp. 13R65 TaxID=3127458 RepID=UPI00301B8699